MAPEQPVGQPLWWEWECPTSLGDKEPCDVAEPVVEVGECGDMLGVGGAKWLFKIMELWLYVHCVGDIGEAGEHKSLEMEDVFEKTDAADEEPVELIEYKLSDWETRPLGLRGKREVACIWNAWWPLWASFMEYELAEAVTPPAVTPTEAQLLPPIE